MKECLYSTVYVIVCLSRVVAVEIPTPAVPTCINYTTKLFNGRIQSKIDLMTSSNLKEKGSIQCDMKVNKTLSNQFYTQISNQLSHTLLIPFKYKVNSTF